MIEVTTNIPARLKNVALGGHVAGVEDIVDDLSGKTQQIINTEVQDDLESLRDLYQALTKNELSIGPLPQTGEKSIIYRVPNESSYADWMWNGTQFVQMAEYDNAIDNEPTAGSDNLVKSGGVTKANGSFNQISVTTNAKLNSAIKEAIILTLKYGTVDYTFENIDKIGINHAKLINGQYYNGIVLKTTDNNYIQNYRTFATEADALNDCTLPYVYGDNKYVIDWDKIPVGGSIENDCNINQYATDIKFWSYLSSLKLEENISKKHLPYFLTNNEDFNNVVKEMYITSDIDVSKIIAFGIVKDSIFGTNHLTGVSIGLSGGSWITRYYEYTNSEDALAAATKVFVHSGDYFIIDWDNLPKSNNNYLDIAVNSNIKDINYAPAIQMYIAAPTFAVTNNFGLNKVVKEMYLGSSLNVAQIKTISVIKDLVSGSNHLTGLSIQLQDNSWIARYKSFATSADAIAAATPLFVDHDDYFIIDWTNITNNSYYNLIINPNVKNIDFSPAIKAHKNIRTVINITDGSTFISEMERAFAIGNCELNISVGTLDLSSLAEQYWNDDKYSIRGRFCQIGNGCKYNFSSNTKIVCNYVGDNIVLMRNFSIFNADGHNFEINGLIAEGSKLRYIIHDDPDNKDDVNGYTHIYNNCQLKLDNTNVPDVAANNNYYDTIGGGIGSNTTIIVRGGTFNAISNGHETIPVRDFCFHGYLYDYDYLSRVIVENAYLYHTIASGKITGQEEYGEIELIVNNCSMATDINNGDNYDATIIKWNNEIRQ